LALQTSNLHPLALAEFAVKSSGSGCGPRQRLESGCARAAAAAAGVSSAAVSSAVVSSAAVSSAAAISSASAEGCAAQNGAAEARCDFVSVVLPKLLQPEESSSS
jgi:hypothetical protein